jgi:hypothetical protein
MFHFYSYSLDHTVSTWSFKKWLTERIELNATTEYILLDDFWSIDSGYTRFFSCGRAFCTSKTNFPPNNLGRCTIYPEFSGIPWMNFTQVSTPGNHNCKIEEDFSYGTVIIPRTSQGTGQKAKHEDGFPFIWENDFISDFASDEFQNFPYNTCLQSGLPGYPLLLGLCGLWRGLPLGPLQQIQYDFLHCFKKEHFYKVHILVEGPASSHIKVAWSAHDWRCLICT